MSSILDRYGIKEVSDVTFYEIADDGTPSVPVLYLDSLKISNIEQTAENSSARGGKGNPELIMWDFGKEITVTLEDALFSAKSMAIMFGSEAVTGSTSLVKTVLIDAITTSGASTYIEILGESRLVASAVYYDAAGTTSSATYASTFAYAVCTLAVSESMTISISPDTFPGTYYVTGDTFARSEATGKDELFQWIVPKAKLLSEVTLTMEAEGDPSTFNMNLKVLRPKSGDMMKLVKYQFGAA